MNGRKFDKGKVPLDLLPKAALIEVAKVLDFGARKYAPYNWAKGMAYSRLLAAAYRHLWAFESGEDKDRETSVSHLAHAVCCILFLLSYRIFNLGLDDRFLFKKRRKKK